LLLVQEKSAGLLKCAAAATDSPWLDPVTGPGDVGRRAHHRAGLVAPSDGLSTNKILGRRRSWGGVGSGRDPLGHGGRHRLSGREALSNFALPRQPRGITC